MKKEEKIKQIETFIRMLNDGMKDLHSYGKTGKIFLALTLVVETFLYKEMEEIKKDK